MIPFRLTLVVIPVDQFGNRGTPIEIPSNSWVKQMAQIFNAMLRGAGEPLVKDTGGVDRTVTTNIGTAESLRADAAAADDTFGILVGTGVVAEDKDDFDVGTQILEGVGAGQLTHKLVSIFTPVASITGGYRCRVEREFTNSSGGLITVQECTLVVQANVGAANEKFLIIRDRIAGGVAIPNSDSRVFQYQIDFLV